MLEKIWHTDDSITKQKVTSYPQFEIKYLVEVFFEQKTVLK